MAAQEAIVVRGARKRYGNGANVLDGLNMTVSRGSIYGLLGASGCGKTTLLCCVVGVRRLESGDIWVLGGKPGSKGSGIPGPRVGYMPQDISLVKEFTVIGALYYFGRINGLEDESIESRYPFLSNLLQLPPRDRLIKHMSGGQQRRVSFAAALIHKPELLILDEPTVGLDPVLRENIWNFLVKITQEEGTTVVITTHYIEEAKLANKIGLMRCGQLLAEASPAQLLAKCQCQTLEEAFLTLSQKQKDMQESGGTGLSTEYLPELEEITTSSISLANGHFKSTDNIVRNEKDLLKKGEDEARNKGWRCVERKRFKALMIKNILQFLRHPGGILFSLVFPLVQVILFFNAIGRDPKGLMIAVVNEEAGDCNGGSNWGNVVYHDQEYCDFVNLSCTFLHGYESIVDKKFYTDIEEATEAARVGQVVGVMHFGRNFSEALQKRRDFQKDLTADEVSQAEIEIALDMGNRQIGLHVKKKLFDRFFEIFERVLTDCGIPAKFGDMPLRLEQPIFGELDQKFTAFMAPAFLLTVIFFLATSVSSSIIIADRHEGVWDRSIVQGVTTAEILMAHVLTQLTVVVLQVTISLSLSFLQFDLKCRGSMLAVIILMLLMGFCGMCYGFLISVMCKSHTLANYVSTGSFYPVLLLCGCIWPIEGMPRFLQWLSMSLPTTIPGISLRALLDKGYPMDNPQVYSGFLIASGWTVGLIILCILGLRSKATC